MFVYFIQAGDGGPIKIGKTMDVARRLCKMQSDNPARLSVLAASSDLDEREIHARFAHLRGEGEWFAPGAGLLAFVATLPRFSLQGKALPEDAHPLRRYLVENELDDEALAARLPSKPHPDSIRLIKRGHRRPSWDLAFEIETATLGEVSAHELRDLKFYPGLKDAA